MISKEMKLKVIDLVIEDYSTRRVYNDGNARIFACYLKVLDTLKNIVNIRNNEEESILYLDYVRDYRGDMLSTGRINTHLFKEYETVKSYIDKIYGFIDNVDTYIFNNCKELIFMDRNLNTKLDNIITIDLTEPLKLGELNIAPITQVI
jgi:hypothetical protein